MRGVFRQAISCKPVPASFFIAAVGVMTLTAAAQEPASGSQLAAPIAELKLNIPISRKLTGGHTDTFTVHCVGGEFIRVIADQQGIDVAVSIIDPDGKSLVDADGPNGPVGPESASAICSLTADYTVRVISGDPSVPAGEYVLHLDALRAPEPNDRLRIEAEQAAFAGAALFQGTKEEKLRATELFNKAIDDWSKIGDRYEAGLWGTTLGNLWSNMGNIQQAIVVHTHALADERALHDRRAEAEVLTDLASSYMIEGDSSQALDSYNRALPVQRELKDRVNEEATLNGLGQVYQVLGRIEEALDAFTQSLAIARELGDISGEASALNNMGLLFDSLAEHHKALDFYLQALPLVRQLQERTFEATLLSNIGTEYGSLGEHQKGMDYLQQANALSRKVGDRTGEGISFNNIGAAYVDTLEYQKALGAYLQSFTIEHETRDRAHQANTLNNMGWLYGKLNNPADQLACELSGLAEATAVGNPDLMGTSNGLLMQHFRDAHQSELAILFGINAVNAYQSMRKNLAGLDKDMRADFLQSKSSTYRALAELLVADNRLAEAEHVLDLLKDAELKETVRGATEGPAAKSDPLPLSASDRSAEASIAAEASTAASLTDASFEFDRLNALATPTDAEKTSLKALSAKIAAGNAEIQTFFDKTLYEELGGNAKSNARATVADTETSSLSNQLAELGPGTLALYTLAGDQHSYLIVTTATARTRYDLHTNAADLGKLVLALRQELRSPASDPSKDLAALSHILLDPIAADLAAAARRSPDGIPTLLWSLDGVLRYVPMNALFDPAQPQGKQYLAERARNVVITPESRNHLLDQPGNGTLRAAAFGVSQSYLGLHALSGVPAELDAVVHDPTVPASHGPLNGQLLRDDAFTLTALEASLKQHFPVVHIASHFVFQAGSAGESYLLLSGQETGGKGFELTMSQLQTDPLLSFRGTRLLTLSACSTAEADTSGNGREIDSLGMVMQKRDAAAVLATLWDVNDASTSLLMSDFYRRWAATPSIEKVEALRQAQLAMLRGADSKPTTSTIGRGNKVEAAPGDIATTSYSHPYYWAPFVLIGNFR